MNIFGIFGDIQNPYGTQGLDVPAYNTSSGSGLVVLFSNIYRFAIVIAGIYTLINIVLAGYGYLSASGDPKLIQKAFERIWRSILGLIIVAASLLIAALIGALVFGRQNWDLLISPKIYTP